jgi:hypothetical protein
MHSHARTPICFEVRHEHVRFASAARIAMNTTDDESPLAPIDLHTWRVPPPAAIDRDALLGRALAPQTMPPRSLRWGWLFAAIVVINALIATLIVVLVRPDEPVATVALPAGGNNEAKIRELVAQIEEERRERARRIAEIQELRAVVLDLQRKLEALERAERDLTTPRPSPSRVTPPSKRLASRWPQSAELPEAIDRTAISSTIASIKSEIRACGDRTLAVGTRAKARVRVSPDGSVASVTVESEHADLGDCVRDVIQGATFPQTLRGGSFSYPFVF